MKTLLPLAFAIIFACVVQAAPKLLPELTSFAQKHETESELLLTQKMTAVAKQQQPYLTALDSAERAATSSARLPEVAAITRERKAVEEEELGGPFANDLPKTLQGPRKSCVEGLARIEASYLTNQQRIDADYLKAIASLQPRAANNAELAAQLASEKQRVLDNVKAVPKPGAVSRETMEKEVLGRWWWGDASSKLWVSLNNDGKAYLGAKKLTWEINSDGSITFVDTDAPRSKSICRFDLKKNTFTGTDFDGKPVKGVLHQKLGEYKK